MKILDVLSKELNFDYKDIPASFMEALKMNGMSFLHGILNDFHPIFETEDNAFELDYEFPPEALGGIIVFSTDVNAIFGDKPSFSQKIQSIFLSIKAKLQKNKRLSRIIFAHDKVTGVTIGNFMKGRYRSASGTFDETSSSVEIIGIGFDLLCSIASELSREFQQETVLVKDNASHRIVLVKAK